MSKERCCISLQAPFPFRNLVRISFPLKEVDSLSGATNHVCSRLEEVCTILNEQQPGGPLVATPASATGSCQVVCSKAIVGKVFKALLSKQKNLGIKIGDVKSSIDLTPMIAEELTAPVKQAVLLSLSRSGWTLLQGSQLLARNYLDTDPGKLVQCEALVEIAVAVELPSKVYLIGNPGMVRFRPAPLPQMEAKPADAQPSLGVSKELAGIPCRILPSLRLAWIVEVVSASEHMAPGIPAEATALCEHLLGSAWHNRMPLLRLSLWQEDDGPTILFPACCVWTESGLSTMPVKPGSHAAVLQQISCNLEESSAPLWADQPLKVMQLGVYSSDAEINTAALGRWQAASIPHMSVVSTDALLAPGSAPAGQGLPKHIIRDSNLSSLRGFAEPQPARRLSPSLLAKLQQLQLQNTKMLQPKPKPSNLVIAKGRASYTPAHTAAPAMSEEDRADESLSLMTPAPGSTPLAPAQPNASPKVPQLLTRKRVALNAATFRLPAMSPAAGRPPKARATPLNMKKPPKVTSIPERGAAKGIAIGSKPRTAKQPTRKAPTKLATAKLDTPQKPAGNAVVIEQQEVPPSLADPSAGDPPISDPGAGAKRKAATEEADGGEGPAAQQGKEQLVTNQAVRIAAEQGRVKAAPRKRVKADDLDAAAIDTKIQQKHRAGKLSELTIPEMKCFLKARKLPLGGKKADVLARLADCLGGGTLG